MTGIPKTGRTIDGEIAQSGTGGPLDFDIRALEEEEDWFEGIPVDLADI